MQGGLFSGGLKLWVSLDDSSLYFTAVDFPGNAFIWKHTVHSISLSCFDIGGPGFAEPNLFMIVSDHYYISSRGPGQLIYFRMIDIDTKAQKWGKTMNWPRRDAWSQAKSVSIENLAKTSIYVASTITGDTGKKSALFPSGINI